MGDDTSEQPGASTATSAEGAAVPKARTPAKAATTATAAKSAKAGAAAKAKTASPGKTAKKAATKATKSAAAKSATRQSPAPATKAPARKAATPAIPQPAVPPGALAAWAGAAWEAVRQPGDPPRGLAELAVAELGSRAAGWADWLRETYPGVPPQAMARLAAQQARQAGWLTAGAGMAGPLAPVLHPALGGAVRVLLVLRVAAAYGHDPTDPARATDLLELLDTGDRAGRWLGRIVRLAGLRRRPRPLRVLLALAELGEEQDRLELLAHRAIRRFRGLGVAS